MGAFDTRLVGAALRARDDLCMVISPGLTELETVVAGSPKALALVQRLQALTHAHADSLRLAIKDRKPRLQPTADLPCWTRK